MKPTKPFCGRFTTGSHDGVINRNASLTHFAWTFGFLFQCLLQNLSIFTNFLYIWHSHLKQLMCEQIMWNILGLRYVAETLPRLAKSPNSAYNIMHLINNCSCCTTHSDKVRKSLQICPLCTLLTVICLRCHGNTCVYMWYRNRPFLLCQETKPVLGYCCDVCVWNTSNQARSR